MGIERLISNKKNINAYYIRGDNVLTNILMAFFFIVLYYGLYCLIEIIDVKSRNISGAKKNNLMIAILAKNLQENIEFTIKELRESRLEGFTNHDKIVIIDMDSTDGTWDILNILARQDEGIIALKFEEKERIFEEFRDCIGR